MRRLIPLLLLAVLVPAAAHARGKDGPVSTSLPTIVGTPKVEAPLSATAGTWTDAGPISYSYAWEQCDASGAACMPLPYDTQSITSLHAVVGQTVRVVVTATAADGAATAASTPKVVVGAGSPSGPPRTTGGSGAKGGGLKITFVRPRARAVVHTRAFAVVVRVAGAVGPIRVRLDSDLGGSGKALIGKGPTFRFPLRIVNGQLVHVDVSATSGSKTGEATEAFSVEPPVTAVQDLSGALTAPGCATCLVHDPSGDNLGGLPDLASASSSVSGGWVTLNVSTFGPVRSATADGGHPCIAGWPIVSGKRNQLGMGCFGGPHTGRLFGGCPHPDANGDCGPVQTTYPDIHTIRYRFRISQLPGSAGIAWQAWVLYPGDQLKDTIPSVAHLGNGSAPNCTIITEWKLQQAGAYRFGQGRCSQAGVSVAKPSH